MTNENAAKATRQIAQAKRSFSFYHGGFIVAVLWLGSTGWDCTLRPFVSQTATEITEPTTAHTATIVRIIIGVWYFFFTGNHRRLRIAKPDRFATLIIRRSVDGFLRRSSLLVHCFGLKLLAFRVLGIVRD